MKKPSASIGNFTRTLPLGYRPYEAHGSLNALGLNSHIEAGSSTAYLDRNIHCLRSAPLPPPWP